VTIEILEVEQVRGCGCEVGRDKNNGVKDMQTLPSRQLG
jgi:hypothetical protein